MNHIVGKYRRVSGPGPLRTAARRPKWRAIRLAHAFEKAEETCFFGAVDR
jgi:hypothetical protein